jgi:hypothetical protein
MRKINKKTGEISSVRINGLWSHFPIPAYQVLAEAREFQAQRVLMALTSFLGDEGLAVFPSYVKIARTCGISQNGIRKALNTLEEYGFIKTFQWKEGHKTRNKYYFQESCWDTGKMNRQALSFRPKLYKCLDCAEYMDAGGFGTGPLGKTHFGCGGPVISRRQDINSGTYLQSLQRSGNSEAVRNTPSLPSALGVDEYKVV